MKLITTILLIFIFAFESVLPRMDLYEMEKINHLIEHLNSHRDIQQHLSFFTFLSLHYGHNDSHKDNDHHGEDHQNLPFKGHSYWGTPFSFISFPLFAGIEILKFNPPKENITYFLEFRPIHYSKAIFQPPRQA